MAVTVKKVRQIADDFVGMLEKIKDNRGKMASLRQCLGKTTEESYQAHKVIMPTIGWLAKNYDVYFYDWQTQVFYLVASLFSVNPDKTINGNMGVHAKTTDMSSDMFERLLEADSHSLLSLLPGAVKYVESKGGKINFRTLLVDLWYWDHPNKFSQYNWAQGYWGVYKNNSESEDENSEEGE